LSDLQPPTLWIVQPAGVVGGGAMAPGGRNTGGWGGGVGHFAIDASGTATAMAAISASVRISAA